MGIYFPPKPKKWYDDCELAWAAGFFDGEGSIGLAGGKRLRATINQIDRGVLDTFHEAVGFGSISGPHQSGNRAHPLYKWQCSGFEQVQFLVVLLWPWLNRVKRAQYKYWLPLAEHQRRLVSPRCKRGHSIAEVGRNSSGACNACLPILERSRRR